MKHIFRIISSLLTICILVTIGVHFLVIANFVAAGILAVVLLINIYYFVDIISLMEQSERYEELKIDNGVLHIAVEDYLHLVEVLSRLRDERKIRICKKKIAKQKQFIESLLPQKISLDKK